jgi:hypothetical protein
LHQDKFAQLKSKMREADGGIKYQSFTAHPSAWSLEREANEEYKQSSQRLIIAESKQRNSHTAGTEDAVTTTTTTLQQ